jgi:serine phosphatase RsbU (regulator of sigma subunit)
MVKFIKGDSDKPKPFTNHAIDLESGDLIFLYTDQFVGYRGNKFLKRRFHQLLINSNHLSMENVEIFLESEFLKWKKETKQVDDVTIIVIRIE